MSFDLQGSFFKTKKSLITIQSRPRKRGEPLIMYSIDFSLTNGLGSPAISIYYSGCDIPIKCKECHNQELWEIQDSLISYEQVKEQTQWYKDFNPGKKLIVSFIGGDPLAKYNRDSVIHVSKSLKEDFPGIELIVYSWRMPSEIESDWVKYMDYGVLGQFDIGEYKENYLPGSTNQIIYNFETKEVIEPIKLK